MTTLPIRIGHGYDIHRFGSKRALILGGVEIPHNNGLIAHSDGDCLTHAICDALLGALGLQDIGVFFPNDDPKLEGISSLKILGKVIEKCDEAGYLLGNLDSTIVAEEPMITPHVHLMRKVLAEELRCAPSNIAIKATTNEQIGDLGRSEGIAAFAVCLLVAKTP